nr:MAG TPA: hypothetical protein [Caudoviricetes sp.]
MLLQLKKKLLLQKRTLPTLLNKSLNFYSKIIVIKSEKAWL